MTESYRILYANRWASRLWGWCKRGEHDGVWLQPCACIHTFAMTIPLSLFWLDASGRLLREDTCVAPNRIRFCWGAASVIEVSAQSDPKLRSAIQRAFV